MGGEPSLERVRSFCLGLPGTSEKLSHGEPTFFVKKRVFVMYAGNHRHDGRVALWLPVEPGLQSILIENEASVYFKPPYVGTKGWIGIELASIDDETLLFHIRNAWELIEAKK